MMAQPPEDPFILDIRDDLERVDRVMTQVVSDPLTRSEFVRDPSSVMTRLGLHPATTMDIYDRVNRAFYAALTNRELIDEITSIYEELPASEVAENRNHLLEGMEEGRIANRLSYDLIAAQHLRRDPERLRRIYRIALHDLNRRRILRQVHSEEAIDRHIEALVEAVVAGQPLREHPQLESWDRLYGVGRSRFVVLHIEIVVGVTAVVGVEIFVASTIAVIGLVEPGVLSEQTIRRAAHGDMAALRALSTASGLVRLASEVMTHAYQFEQDL